MPLTVVTDWDTLFTFSKEIGRLCEEANNMMRFPRTNEEFKLGMELYKMCITLNKAIIEEEAKLIG